MKNKLICVCITFLSVSTLGFAQFDAPWEKDAGLENARRTPKTFRESQQEFYDYWKNKDATKEEKVQTGEEGEEGGYQIFKRWEDYWSTRLLEDGTVPSTNRYWEEYEKMQTSFRTTRAADISLWKSLGPFDHTGNGSWSPGQGRVNVVVEDPINPKIIYVGAPNGGLWVSRDDGSTWSPLTDKLPRIGVGAIAIDPKDTKIIYLGMGDDEASDCPSIGVMKSTDGGLTWDITGLQFNATGGGTNNYKVTDIIIDPSNSSILWASTSDGLYKTKDAGATWNKTQTGNMKGINLKPGTSTTLYAVTTNKFYRSTDGGETFTAITSGLPTSAGRFAIDVTPANAEIIYLLASTTGNAYQGVYKSTNGGTSFTAVNTSTDVFENTQSWYTMPIAVSATNENEVYAGCLNVWKSSNGGTSWTRVNNWSTVNGTYTHADIHYIRFYKGRSYVGSDGGIFRSTNSASSYTSLTKGLALSQIYRISGSPANKNILVGGLQDNGGYGWNGTNWNNYYGADGMDCAVDPLTPTTMYGFIQSGNTLYRSTNSGQSGSQYATGKTGAWVTPLVADKDGTLIAGYNDLWRLKGTAWTQISTFSFGGTIAGIEISPADSKVIYAFRSTSVYRTTTGGSSFTNITGTITGTITSVEADYADKDKVWVTVGGWVGTSKIYFSKDGGSTWTNITKNLPNFPANIIKQEIDNPKDALYIGLDVGIYYTDNTLTEWVPFMKDLPNSSVRDLEINEKTHLIRAATFGRGVWESYVYDFATGVTTTTDSEDIKIYPNPSPGVFTIRLEGSLKNEVINVAVYNQLGELVLNTKTNVNEAQLHVDLTTLPNGTYVVRFKTGNMERNAKFLKQ